MADCFVCRTVLPDTAKRRRLQSSASVCSELEAQLRAVSAAAENSADSASVTTDSKLPSRDAFLCLPCFRRLEKMNKLKKEVFESDCHIQSKLKEKAGLPEPRSHLSKVKKRLIPLSVSLSPKRIQLEQDSTPSKGKQKQSVHVSTPLRHKKECVTISQPVSPRKRPLQDQETPTQPKRKRQQITTPVRRVREGTVVENSPGVAVVVTRKTSSSVHNLTSSMKKLGRSVGRCRPSGIARQVMSHRRIRVAILKEIGLLIRREMKSLCSKKSPSLLRKKVTSESLLSFTWKTMSKELEDRSPILLRILRECLTRKRRKTTRRKTRSVNDDTIACLCAGALLRHRNCRMTLMQRIISLLLYSEHATKLTFRRLQKLHLCLSHPATISTVDLLGKDHDVRVLEWKENLRRSLTGSQENEDQAEIREDQNQHSEGGIEDQQAGIQIENQQSMKETENQSTAGCEDENRDDFTDFLENPFPEVDNQSESSTTATESQSSEVETEESSSTVESSATSSSSNTLVQPVLSPLNTFKIVGDNINKYIKPRDMRIDAQAETLDFFNLYAVRDRVPVSGLDDSAALPSVSSCNVGDVLPTTEDHCILFDNISYLVARVLKKYIPFFAKFADGLKKHIKHKYYEEMAQKSDVVPLGILPRNEMNYDDMIKIMEAVQEYVPIESNEEEVSIPGRPPMKVTLDKFHYTLFGGDMLTAARARGSKNIVCNSQRGKDRIEGVIPVVEDWHAKLCLLEVIWKRLYRISSSREAGTLYQLRNLINRRNVVKKPKKDVAACEEFFELVVEAHIVTAAMEVFRMSSIDDTPTTDVFPQGSSKLSKQQRSEIVLQASRRVVDKFCDISYPNASHKDSDNVHAYAKEVLSLGLLFLEFTDSIREGDGLRILRCWRFFLPLFKANGRKNYSIEAFITLSQYHFLLTDRLKHQLIWNRTVNTSGRPGKNIPCDLHMEHLNRVCKQAMGNLGSNVNREHSVIRIGKSIGSLSGIMASFDSQIGLKKESGKHTKRSASKDMEKIIKQLTDAKVFSNQRKRKHKSFKNFQANSTRTVKVDTLTGWMNVQLKKLLTSQ